MSFAGTRAPGTEQSWPVAADRRPDPLPELVPPGVTTTLLLILFFGSLNLFAIGLLGEYIAKIFEEVKRRPHFIRRSISATARSGPRRTTHPSSDPVWRIA